MYSHVADEGWMDACAGGLLRFRKQIGAEDINIFTDIKKKHWYAKINNTFFRHTKEKKPGRRGSC